MIIIDRFEGTWAVCETDTGIINIPKSNIYGEAKEGSVLIKESDERYVVDISETAKRKDGIEKRFFGLFKD